MRPRRVRRRKRINATAKAQKMKCTTLIAAKAALTASTTLTASTVAFYSFENGGVVGSAATAITNDANPGTYDAETHRLGTESDGWGELPCWTNNVSGNCIYSDAACTQIVARAPMAIHFTRDPSNSEKGGCLEMAGLAKDIYGLDSFTIEFFWRQAESIGQRSIMSLFYNYHLRLCSGVNANRVRMDANDGTSTNDKIIQFMGSSDTRNLHQYGWRHWAVTVDKATSTATLYFDYDNYGGFTGGIIHSIKSQNLRFGSRQLGDYSGTEVASGELTCVRVSDRILTPDEFMRMGVAAYYPFKDAAAGETATTITNAAVAGSGDGFAGHIGDAGKTPKFSADRPGRYIYSSPDKANLLCEEPGSLEFNNGSSDADGYVSIPGLAGNLVMATREKSAITFECFFKKENLAWGNLGLFSFDPGGRPWQAKIDTISVVSNQDTTQRPVAAGTEGETLANDGVWHHMAVVFGPNTSNASSAKQWKSATVYIDYAQPTNSMREAAVYWTQATYWDTWSDLPFIIGHKAGLPVANNGFSGKISSVRITSAALTPDQFMVASDTNAAPSADGGFRWRFEEGTAGASIASVADASGTEKWTCGEVTTYGSGAVVPSFSSSRPASHIKIGDDESDNALSALMATGEAGSRAVLENKTWYGIPALHPESWTMEFFAKASATPSSNALLAGRGRLNVSTGAEWSDWSLALQPDGKLALSGYRDDGSGGKTAFSFANLGAQYADGKWHRFEIVHDGVTHNYGVWADGVRILDQTLASSQVDTTNARYQFGAGCGLAALAGNIDEVRFVGRALSPALFAMPKDAATTIVLR